jgi:hypothetical protein
MIYPICGGGPKTLGLALFLTLAELKKLKPFTQIFILQKS